MAFQLPENFYGDWSKDIDASAAPGAFSAISGALGSVLPFAGPAISLLQGLGVFGGGSPEEQARKARQDKLKNVLAAIDAETKTQQAMITQRTAGRVGSSRQRGGRQAAAIGAGSGDIFSGTEVAGLYGQETDALTNLGMNATSQRARAEAEYGSGPPSYEFPQTPDWLSAAAGGATAAINQNQLFDIMRNTRSA
jgi:hypothetical protein